MAEGSGNLFVVTGGPGSGKSTLIEAIARAGHQTADEVGRAIIQQQMLIGGRGLPWADPELFAEMMLSWQIMSHQRYVDAAEQPVFCDRGLPDVIGYLRLLERPVPDHMVRAAERFRYHRRVFIAPPWPEIFTHDRERKQSLEEAIRTYEAMVQTYPDFGYTLIELPRTSVAERRDFVLSRTSEHDLAAGTA